MALKLKKNPAKSLTLKAKRQAKGTITSSSIVQKPHGLKESTLVKVFDVPIEMLVDHKENPNQQSEKTFDELVDKIKRDGFDEPLIVVPHLTKGRPDGKYLIISGHHRKKAAVAAGMSEVPAIIREGWSEDQAAIELINRNSLTGQMDPFKFTELYQRLSKRYDPEQLRKMMGLTDKKQFNQLYKTVADNLPPKQKKKLEDAKEKIKSIDDLTGILHEIFAEHGSELDFGFLVFSHGGKNHHYIKVSDATEKHLKTIETAIEDADVNAEEVFAAILADLEPFDNVIRKLKAKKVKSSAKAA